MKTPLKPRALSPGCRCCTWHVTPPPTCSLRAWRLGEVLLLTQRLIGVATGLAAVFLAHCVPALLEAAVQSEEPDRPAGHMCICPKPRGDRPCI